MLPWDNGAGARYSTCDNKIPVIPAKEVDLEDDQHDLIPGNWRDEVIWLDVDAPPERRNRGTVNAKQQRE